MPMASSRKADHNYGSTRSVHSDEYPQERVITKSQLFREHNDVSNQQGWLKHSAWRVHATLLMSSPMYRDTLMTWPKNRCFINDSNMGSSDTIRVHCTIKLTTQTVAGYRTVYYISVSVLIFMHASTFAWENESDHETFGYMNNRFGYSIPITIRGKRIAMYMDRHNDSSIR